MVRTPGFQPDNRGSIPRSGTNEEMGESPFFIGIFLVF